MKVSYDNDMMGYKVLSEGQEELFLNSTDAAFVVKELYRLGLEFDMPSTDSYLQGRLEAIEAHLADMRRLVMDGLPGETK